MSRAIFDDFEGRAGAAADLPNGLTAPTAAISGAVTAGSVTVGSTQVTAAGVTQISGAAVVSDALGYVPAQVVLPVEIAAVLTAGDAAANDYYGSSVALSADGSVMAVGSHSWEGSSTDQGGVYIYDWIDSAWVQRGEVLTAGDAAANDRYGASVALSADGSVMAVGAFDREGYHTNQGCVYIYDWIDSAWVQREPVLTAGDAAEYDRYGISVALSADGSVMAVGAFDRDGSSTNQGCVYIYDWIEPAWVQREPVLTAGDAAGYDHYGISVALSSDASVLAVGAHNWEGSSTDQGAVYLYDWIEPAWVQREPVLTAGDAAAGDQYGRSVALSSDASVLAVGAYSWEGSNSNQGAVYLYDWSGGEWVQRGAVLTAGDAAGNDQFGISVALSSDATVLAVGANGWEGSSTDQGAVYTYATASSLQSATQRLLSYIQSLSARIAALGG